MKLTNSLEELFDTSTLSVHIIQGQPIVAKKWKPWWRKLIPMDTIRDKTAITHFLEELTASIQHHPDSFMEIERAHSFVYQIGAYRIVVVLPPVSKLPEITIVKQLVQLSLDAYELAPELLTYLLEQAKGIVIAGAPGEGKSTFAQAFIAKLAEQSVVIKTIEAPRDLIVPPWVTQYSFGHASHNEIRDILLLSRPDYSVYDEIRNREDFALYKDLRLTGIGLIGVMHATAAIDSIQRFLSAVDLGTLPQVIDTVVFIKGGRIEQILNLHLTVKTPWGMVGDDLARPIVIVSDLVSKVPLYEIYTFGDNTVVMPLNATESQGWATNVIASYASQALEAKIQQLLGVTCVVEVKWPQSINLTVPESMMGRVIGKAGATIQQLERSLKLSISVKEAFWSPPDGDLPHFTIKEQRMWGKKSVVEVIFGPRYAHQQMSFMIEGELTRLTTNHLGIITLRRKKHIDASRSGAFHLVT
jgi:ATPase